MLGRVKMLLVTIALWGLVLLPMVDLAVLDLDHASLELGHVQTHVWEQSQDHTHAHTHHSNSSDDSHDDMNQMSVHLAFHTLLGAFIETPAPTVLDAVRYGNIYGGSILKSAQTVSYSPPVPPPLF